MTIFADHLPLLSAPEALNNLKAKFKSIFKKKGEKKPTEAKPTEAAKPEETPAAPAEPTKTETAPAAAPASKSPL